MREKIKKTLFFVLATALVAQGCITTAATLAIKHSRSKKSDEAKIEVEATPSRVYEAELEVLEKDHDTKIIKKDPGNHLVEAQKGNDRITAKVTPIGGGKTELVVTAMSKDDLKASEEPALDIEEDILDELGLKYKVIEE